MENFNELESLWKAQSAIEPSQTSGEIIEKAKLKIKSIKSAHFWTIGILSTLIVVLLSYYFWIYNSQIANQIKGLGIMILVIIVRVILEIISIILFRKIDFTLGLNEYILQLISFYRLRRLIHLVLTPIIYLSYCFGFMSLLPLFKENFSKGFYLYLLISGIGFLVFFSFMLFKIIRKDINNLAFLKQV
jgi:hypothetical protein